MLDDGSECKKEIHSIGFFPSTRSLSGDKDPSVDRQQNQDKLREKWSQAV